MAKDIQKKVRNTIFLYFLKHILYILSLNNHTSTVLISKIILHLFYISPPTFTHKPEGLFKRTESGRGTPK